MIFSDLGSFANTLIIDLPAAGGQRSAGDSTATTRGLRSTRDQEPTTAAGNAGRPWHLGQGEGGIYVQENSTTPCYQDLTEKQVQKMQVNISPRPEKPTTYFSGFDKRTGAELAGRLGKETWLVCLIGSISVAGFDQATGERNAGASHDHIMQMSTLSQGVGSERGCSLRSFFNCKCSPIQCFPGRRSFKISTKQKSSLGPDCRWPKLGQT